MATTVIKWKWTEAFEKFGFGDGDGPNMTGDVADFLTEQGWEVQYGDPWAMHNTIITKMEKGGQVIEPDGYDNPRLYLPINLVKALDKRFKSMKEDVTELEPKKPVKVIVHVKGGRAYVNRVPKGIQVKIIDHDRR